MADALHSQTLLTCGMNDDDLPASFGGRSACACRAN
jgi:DMSO/TMAO reductase YedYZ molybdopterin-dependent catalytic subunit